MKMKTVKIKSSTNELNKMEAVGIATTYGNKDRDGDIIEKGAFINFKDTSSASLPLLYNHDPNKVIGKICLTDKEDGVEAVAEFCEDLELARDVYKLVKFGAVASMSIGFIPLEAELMNANDVFGGVVIKSAELLETSIVPIPANPEAKITSVKSLSSGAVQLTLGETNEQGDNLEKYKNNLLKQL